MADARNWVKSPLKVYVHASDADAIDPRVPLSAGTMNSPQTTVAAKASPTRLKRPAVLFSQQPSLSFPEGHTLIVPKTVRISSEAALSSATAFQRDLKALFAKIDDQSVQCQHKTGDVTDPQQTMLPWNLYDGDLLYDGAGGFPNNIANWYNNFYWEDITSQADAEGMIDDVFDNYSGVITFPSLVVGFIDWGLALETPLSTRFQEFNWFLGALDAKDLFKDWKFILFIEVSFSTAGDEADIAALETYLQSLDSGSTHVTYAGRARIAEGTIDIPLNDMDDEIRSFWSLPARSYDWDLLDATARTTLAATFDSNGWLLESPVT